MKIIFSTFFIFPFSYFSIRISSALRFSEFDIKFPEKKFKFQINYQNYYCFDESDHNAK